MKEPQPKLKLNDPVSVIKPRQRNIYVDEFGKLHEEPVRTESKEYRGYRETRSNIKGVFTPRKIQLFRWHYRFLQLALELESLDFTFTEYRRRKAKGKKNGYDERYQHKVVVNRGKYLDWDLEEILTSNFDRWWQGHSGLFVETPSHATEIMKPADVVPNNYFRYFRIDTRMTTANSIRSIRQQLNSSRRASKWTSKWVPTGEVRQEKLFNTYNALVMWLEGKTTKEILSSGLFRASRGHEITYLEPGVGKSGRATVAKENIDKMKDLLFPGRRLVLIAADGYFAKHPRNKKYFGKK